MSRQKEARPVAGTTERAKEPGQASRQDRVSIDYDTTSPQLEQAVHIADFLSRGQDAAVPLRHIKQLVHLPGREIRKQIQLEREQHIPIVSDHNGYYIAETEQERDRFVRGMKRRAAEIVKVAEAVGEADV